jgi:hypothetical protein
VIFTKTKEPKPAGRSLTDIDGDLLAWRSRREQLGVDLEDARARVQRAVEKRGQATAELVPDEKAVKQARSEHTAATAESEELELAIAAVDERLRGLDAERTRAERHRVITAALASLDRVGAIASRVDADWEPVRDQMVRLISAAADAATALKGAHPGQFQTFELNKAQLTHVLLWRVRDLLELPPSFGERCTSAVELVSFTQIRAKLEAELADQEGAHA